MLEPLDFTIRIGSTPTFLYLSSAYAAHYVYSTYRILNQAKCQDNIILLMLYFKQKRKNLNNPC